MKQVWGKIYDIIKTCELDTWEISTLPAPIYRMTRGVIIGRD